MKMKLAGSLGTLLMLFGSYAAVADIKMGVFPRRPVAVTHKAFTPLAEELSKQLGEKVQLVVPKDFKTFWKGVANNEFDLVHYNQYHYIKSHKEHGYKVIVANEERGSKVIAGALSVRKDSGIGKVEDLKGKTILFGGGPKAMGSYIAPTAILKKHGLKAEDDYTVKFAKNPPSAAIGVFHGAADAAGTGNVVLQIGAVTKKIDASEMTVLAESEPFTHLCWAVRADMADSKAGNIQSAMTSLSGGVLKSAKVTGFYKVDDGDFAKVREITQYAVGETY